MMRFVNAPLKVIIDCASLGLGQTNESLILDYSKLCVDSNVDVDCSNFEPVDSDVDPDTES